MRHVGAFAVVTCVVGCGNLSPTRGTAQETADASATTVTAASTTVPRTIVDDLRDVFVSRGADGGKHSLVILGSAKGFEERDGQLLPRITPSQPRRYPTSLRLPKLAGDALRLDYRGAQIDVELQGVARVAGETTTDSVIYRAPFAHATLFTIPFVDGAEDYVHFEEKPGKNELRYRLRMRGVSGLRLVENVLEVQNEIGATLFHTTAPWLVDARGVSRSGTISVEGCSYDADVHPPQKRPITAPGADACTVVVRWDDAGLTYPILVDPAWSSGGSMAVRRQFHAVSTLYNGYVCSGTCLIVSGGYGPTGTPLASADMYDEGNSSWSTIASLNTARYNHGSATAAWWNVAVLGGRGVAASIDSGEVYNTCCGWGQTAGVTAGAQAREGTRGAFLGGTAWGTGVTVFTSGTDVMTFAPSGSYNGGTWGRLMYVQTPSLLGDARTFHGMTSWYGGFLVAGGRNSGGALGSIEFLEFTAGGPPTPNSAGWVKKPGVLSPAREEPVAVTLAGQIVIAGGINNGTVSGAVDMFSLSGFGVSAGQPIRGLTAFTGAAVGNSLRALFVGGYNSSYQPVAYADVVDGSGSAAQIADMSYLRAGAAAARIEWGPNAGGVIVTGGSNGYQSIAPSEEIYLPSGNSAMCSKAADCTSGYCVDGRCCDSACGGVCQACNLSGSSGTCTAIPAGGSPVHGSCSGSPTGGTCGYACNGSDTAACHAAASSVPCQAAACTTTTSSRAAAFCTGSGSCSTNTATTCSGNLICNSSSGLCKTTCSGNTDCDTGYKCSGTSCVSAGTAGASCTGAPGDCDASLTCVDSTCCATSSCTGDTKCNVAGYKGQCVLPYGTPCTGANAAQCPGGASACVDGVCCTSACAGQCEACDVPTKVGTCTPIAGDPHNARTKCTGTGACQAKCDGTNPISCGPPPNASTPCATPSCVDGIAKATAYCDGSGACGDAVAKTCKPYLCGASDCKTVCAADTDCATGYTCRENACVPKAGVSCTAASDCTSGYCVDGVCCNTACAGQCEACDVPGASGTCTAASGAVHGSRTACSDGGGDVCRKLACDGTDRTKCAAYANGLDTSCKAAACQDGTLTRAAVCDGKGSCGTGNTESCAPYVCDGTTQCKTSCATTSDCANGFLCASGKCSAITAKCSDDHTQSVPLDGKTPAKACAPFSCDPSTGNCFDTCSGSEQCVAGALCDANQCRAIPEETQDEAGGCTFGSSRAKSVSSLLFALLAVASLRRRRQRTA